MTGTQFVVATVTCLAGWSALAAPPGAPRDFDGDGFDDLVAGLEEGVGGFNDAGAAHVLPGSAAGVTAGGSKFFHQNKNGFDDNSETSDNFSSAMTIGDFDGDGFADLAIGVGGETLYDGEMGEASRAGAVHVVYGSGNGLRPDSSQFLHQDIDGVEGVAEEDDFFGRSVTAGDFDGDGFDDLAVGVFGQEVSALPHAGAVQIFYGSDSGLRVHNDEIWHLDVPGMKGVAGANDNFGQHLVAGDFDGDGRDDLAVGSSSDPGGNIDAGSVNILYGSPGGLTADGDQLFTQDSSGILDDAEPGDFFGSSLSAGDFDGDGFDDLAVGAVLEGIEGSVTGAETGAVHIIYGTDDGLRARNNQLFHLDSPGVPGLAEGSDGFGGGGVGLAAGDFNGDDRDDLAISATALDVNAVADAGGVVILYGAQGSLSTNGARLFHQDVPGIPSDPEENDHFGFALATGDFNGDGFDDLGVGVSSESLGGVQGAGAVNVIYGTADGLKGAGGQIFHQDTPGVADAPETNELFGRQLPNG